MYRKRKCIEIPASIDDYSVFQESTRQQDQDLARTLFDALAAIDCPTARQIMEKHANDLKRCRESTTTSQASGKWNLFSDFDCKVGYLRLDSQYNGCIFIQDEQLGNVYCQVEGLSGGSHYQASGNVKLAVRAHQLGEVSGPFTGLLALNVTALSPHQVAALESAQGTTQTGFTSSQEALRVQLHLDPETGGLGWLGDASEGGRWEVLGVRCV